MMADEIDYSKRDVPDRYHCSVCGKGGVKLWRQYKPMHGVSLLCVDHAQQDQGVSYNVVEDGSHGDGHRTNFTIQWLVPAVPDSDDCEAYWGYMAIPPKAFEWWKRLPLR